MKHQRTNNRVLLVSDDFTVRESLGDILQSGGFEVLPTANEQQAVEALEANRIGVIVLDHRTLSDASEFSPGKVGTLEVLTDIDPFLPLVLTCSRETDLDHASSLMADLVLRHPIAPLELLEGVDTLLTETLRDRVLRKSASFVHYR